MSDFQISNYSKLNKLNEKKKELFFINDPDVNSSTFIIINIYIINELFELTIVTL